MPPHMWGLHHVQRSQVVGPVQINRQATHSQRQARLAIGKLGLGQLGQGGNVQARPALHALRRLTCRFQVVNCRFKPAFRQCQPTSGMTQNERSARVGKGLQQCFILGQQLPCGWQVAVLACKTGRTAQHGGQEILQTQFALRLQDRCVQALGVLVKTQGREHHRVVAQRCQAANGVIRLVVGLHGQLIAFEPRRHVGLCRGQRVDRPAPSEVVAAGPGMPNRLVRTRPGRLGVAHQHLIPC